MKYLGKISETEDLTNKTYIDDPISKLGNAIGMRGWNQIVIPTGATSITHNGITFTNNKDGTVTANGTATAQAFTTVGSTIKANHTYCVCGCSGGALTKYYLQQNYYNSEGTQVAARDYGDGVLFTNYQDGSLTMYILVQSNVTVSNIVFKPQLFDLTAIFGDDVPTLAQFRAMFSADYYPYCSGGFGDLLWTNSSPTSAFADNTSSPISLDLSNYAHILVQYRQDNTAARIQSSICSKGCTTLLSYTKTKGATVPFFGERLCTVTSSTVAFTDAETQTASTTASINNLHCIPYKIYGLR